MCFTQAWGTNSAPFSLSVMQVTVLQWNWRPYITSHKISHRLIGRAWKYCGWPDLIPFEHQVKFYNSCTGRNEERRKERNIELMPSQDKADVVHPSADFLKLRCIFVNNWVQVLLLLTFLCCGVCVNTFLINCFLIWSCSVLDCSSKIGLQGSDFKNHKYENSKLHV